MIRVFRNIGEPSTSAPSTPHQPVLGLVIPCFRESRRLPGFLPALMEALDGLAFPVRVLVVDDGSGAEEAGLLENFIEHRRQESPGRLLPLLRLPENIGKGGAVRAGWDQLAGTCTLLGFVDADGAVPAAEVVRVARMAAAGDNASAWFGSRLGGSGVKRSPVRRLIGWGFRTFTRLAAGLPVRDSQCGFKVLPAAAYQRIRAGLRENHFAFDVELTAALLDDGTPIRETPIAWKEQPGGHVRPTHALAMLTAVLKLGIARRARKSPAA